MNKIQSVQIALFLATVDLTDRLLVASKISKKLNNFFDGQPVMLPVPNDAPSEIPRIILKTQDEEFSLQISAARVDLFFRNSTNKDIKYQELFIKLKTILHILSECLIGDFTASINRLGIIVNASPSGLTINNVQDFFDKNNMPVIDKEEIQISLLNKEKIKSFNINNWIRIIVQKHDKSKPKITLSNDINLRSENVFTLTLDQVDSFYIEAFRSIEFEFKKYAKYNDKSSRKPKNN